MNNLFNLFLKRLMELHILVSVSKLFHSLTPDIEIN